MPLLDMSLEQMRDYRPPLEEPDDFDPFWARTLEETRDHDLNATFEPIESGFETLDVFDLTFAGV